MLKELFFVEVGILLDKEDEDASFYHIDNFYMNSFYSFYDENRLAFLDKNKALAYLKDYVKNGVETTYGILHSYICDIDDEQLQEIINFKSYEFIDNPTKETTLYFECKLKSQVYKLIKKEQPKMKVYLLIDEYLSDTCNTNITVCKDIKTLKQKFMELSNDITTIKSNNFECVWSDDEPLSSYIYTHNIAQRNIYIEEKEIF